MSAPNHDCEQLLADIRAEAHETRHATGRDAFAERVLDALRDVPREEFVTDALRHQAYANHPLPIGRGQTISQPFIVALMTDLIDPRPHHTVLEIGAGSGYQAAVLARLVRKVYTLEILDELAQDAARRLQRLGCANVEVATGNGWLGWPEHAPYDAILVAAAAAHVPDALVAQLKPGGRMVVPVGLPHEVQDLVLVTRDEDGRVARRSVLPVAFVPLVAPMLA